MNPTETDARQFGTAGGILVPAPPLRLICIGSPRISLSLCLAFSRLSDNDFKAYLQSPFSCLKNILGGELIPLSLGR